MITTATCLVAIENIQPGDVVLAANEETGEVAYKEVVRTFVNTTDEITHVIIENAEGEQETIDSTPEHPFYVKGKGWVNASALHAGMAVWLADSTQAIIQDVWLEYAVASIRSGDDIKTVQGNLGHATAAFTLDVYGYVTDQMREASSMRMQAYIQEIMGQVHQ